MTSIGDIHALLRAKGGLAVVGARDLRDTRAAGRLGRHVRSRIEHDLDAAEVGFWPSPLPNDQRQLVTLYDKRTLAGRLMEAAIEAADLGIDSQGGVDEASS